MKADPRRSCIACRQVLAKEELFRYVLSPDGELVPDLKGKLPGRGAYTCPTAACLRKALERKQFSRAFRKDPAPIPPEELLQRIRNRIADSAAGDIALANKAGKVVSGTDAVLAALKTNEITLLIIAEDCSAETAERLQRAAGKGKVEVLTFFTRERLAALIGKEMRIAVAVKAGGLAAALKRHIELYRNFSEGGALDE